MARRIAVLLVAITLAAPLLSGAERLPVWREPARAQRYLEASGRRSAMLGNGAGVFEAWLFPIKVCHDLRLLFQVEGSLERMPADTLASWTEVTPAATTIVYSHAAFTVRETVWAPRETSAIVIELDVDSSQALTAFVEFRSDLKPMWPASLGGQYNSWSAEDHAMVLAEPTHHAEALIGSDAFEAYSDEGDHMLPDRPTVLRLRKFKEGRSRASVVIAGGAMSGDAARKIYGAVRNDAESLRTELESYWREFLDRTTQLETPDAEVNRAFEWGRVALEKGFACNEGVGCGLIAGYGPSGSSERPGFGWYFGGDAFMNVGALVDYGDFQGARAALEFLRARQRPDGKMMHEMSMSAALMKALGSDWFQLPYAYYHADTTPLYIVAARAYFQRSGDRAFLEESWPSLEKAYAYCAGTLGNDGLMSNVKAGLAAVETGALRGKVQQDVYLQGFWLGAAGAMAELAAQMKQPRLAAEARAHLEHGRASLNSWFSDQKQLFPFGLLTDGSKLDALTAWPAVALVFAGLDEKKSRAAVDALARPELSTDWGIRWVATDSGIYNPLGYNDGSVWPFMTGYAIQAMYRQHRAFEGWQHLAMMAGLTGFAGPAYLPENFSGDRRQTLPHAVPHQLFSTGVGVLQSFVSGMLGLRADADRKVIEITPHIPAEWDFVRLSNYRVGDDAFDFELRQQEGEVQLSVQARSTSSYELRWSPALPAGARPSGSRVRHMLASAPAVAATDRDEHVRLTTTLQQSADLAVEYAGGVALIAPVPEPAPGGRTVLPRLIGGACEGQLCNLVFAGLSGRDYRINYRAGGRPSILQVSIPAGEREFGTTTVRVFATGR